MKNFKLSFIVAVIALCFVSCSKKDDEIGENDPSIKNSCSTSSGSCVMVEDQLSKEVLNELNKFREDPANYQFYEMSSNGFYDVREVLDKTKPLPKLILSNELSKAEAPYIRLICGDYKWQHDYTGSTPLDRAKKSNIKGISDAYEALYRTAKDEVNPKSKDQKKLARILVTHYINDIYDTDKKNLHALLDPSWKYVGMSYAIRMCKHKYYYGILLAK